MPCLTDSIRWTRVNHAEDGYDEGDSIVSFAEVGPYYLRISDLEQPGYTWVILRDSEVIAESGAHPTYRTENDAKDECERAFAKLYPTGAAHART